MILPLRSPQIDLEIGGGKGANLSRLMRAGYPVPDGFIVCAQAYQAFVEENGLSRRMAACLDEAPLDALDALEAASQEIRAWFLQGSLPAVW